MIRYLHDETIHNLKDPQIIVPIIMELFNPRSVIDIGCGIGTFLRIFKENGVKETLGLDGNWVDKKKLGKNIDLENFIEINLEDGISLGKKFDLLICLEVMEHIDEKYSDKIIYDLTKLSDLIIFSAAIPGQGGQNHINEKWPDYWENLFNKHGYSFLDILRPRLWNHPELASWYKQNIFVVVRNTKVATVNLDNKEKFVMSCVHPNNWKKKVAELKEYVYYNSYLKQQIERIENGEKSILYYLKLLLVKLKKILSR